MNRTHTQAANPLARYPGPAQHDAIEWEELPSLAQSLNRQDHGFSGSVWTATQRMELFSYDDAPVPAPFAEPINGLHVREIDGLEVFQHFFGRAGISH